MPSPRATSSPSAVSPASSPPKSAALIDGSALFAAVSNEDRRLDYFGLTNALVSQIEGLQRPGPTSLSPWTMWTSADPRNQGQTKFLEFARDRLFWDVRTTPPSQSFMIEPVDIFGISPPETARLGRLIRFDAQIAFAMGRLAETHKLVIVSDSFPLASNIALINEHWGARTGGCVFAFFGHRLDSRWRNLMRNASSIRFVDLDDFQSELFGVEPQEVRPPALEPGKLVY